MSASYFDCHPFFLMTREIFCRSHKTPRSEETLRLDQFYTCPELAKQYATEVAQRWRDRKVLFVEPSAGSGAFSLPLIAAGRKVRAMDIAPAAPHIDQGNFLLQPENLFKGKHSAIVVLGNPPFGKNASTAVRFFNCAADYADEIAFIVPKTFRKMSLQSRLHRRFHLERNDDVGRCAFLLNDKPYDVPCAWQIWKRKECDRAMPHVPCVAHLIEYTGVRDATFAMRRVGFYAGRVITQNITDLSATTHYFMKEVKKGVVEMMGKIEWRKLAEQTVGSRSLSKSEIAVELDRAFNG